MSEPSLFSLGSKCPRCHRGPLFSGLMKLNDSCNDCGLAFEWEEGQTTWGSMVLSYVFSAAIALPLFFVMLVNRAGYLSLAVPVALLAILAPFNVRLSRMVWTHAMYYFHRSDQD